MQPGGKQGTASPVAQTALRREDIRAARHPAAGKTLLVRALRERGYNAREVAQEHSYVPSMWQRITQPDLLIYLNASWEVACRRRSTDAGADWWEELTHRLRHARQHADLYLDTDGLTPEQVLDRTLAFLERVVGSGSESAWSMEMQRNASC